MYEEIDDSCEHEFEIIDQYNNFTIMCKCDRCGAETQFTR